MIRLGLGAITALDDRLEFARQLGVDGLVVVVHTLQRRDYGGWDLNHLLSSWHRLHEGPSRACPHQVLTPGQ